MTLIGAFKLHQTPVIVTDFLVTTGSNNPTIATRRKIIKISSNCVIGWCGSEISAHMALRTLNKKLTSKPIKRLSLDTLASILHGITSQEDSRTFSTFIGWIIDSKGSHCFRWRTDYPKVLFFQDSEGQSQHFDGSGEGKLRECLRAIDSPDFLLGSSNSRSLLNRVLRLIGGLTRDTYYSDNNPLRTYGLAYEAAYYDGRKFVFIPSFVFQICKATVDADFKLLALTPHEPSFKYTGHDDYAELVKSYNSKKSSLTNFMLPPGHSPETYKYPDNKVLRERLKERLNYEAQMDYSAECYMIWLEVHQGDAQVGATLLTQTESESNDTFRFIRHQSRGEKAIIHYYIPQEILHESINTNARIYNEHTIDFNPDHMQSSADIDEHIKTNTSL